jgi:hypothetical protein
VGRAGTPHRRAPLPVVGLTGLVVVGITVLLACGSGGTDPGTPNPSRTAGIDRAQCTPSAEWQHAVAGRELDGGVAGELLLAVSPTGEIVAARDREVRLLEPDGAARTIYTAPDTGQFERAYIEGAHVLVQLTGFGPAAPSSRSAAPSTPPAAAPTTGPVLTRLVLIDTASGEVRHLVQASDADLGSGRNLVDGAAMWDGHVYWDTRPDAGFAQGTIVDYDIATGQTGTRFRGAVGPVLSSAAGIEWSADQSPPAEVPADLPPALTATDDVEPADARTDGTAYAWADRSGIAWASLTTSSAVHIAVPIVPDALVEAVAGPVVVVRAYDDPGPDYLVDTRTGEATATPIDQGALLASGGGLLVTGTPPPASTTPAAITVYDLRGLPALRC